MYEIEEILTIGSQADFDKKAMELFRFQSLHCPPYNDYIRLCGLDAAEIDTVQKIPYLPIEIFKSARVYCSPQEPEAVFTSSTTGGGSPSLHFVRRLSDYEKTFRKVFENFYCSDGKKRAIYALLPGYAEREGSSLIYMIRDLITKYGGGFYLNNNQKLIADLLANPDDKILLGVSFALLELAENHPIKLHNTIVMETGGMKGRREEISKHELHDILMKAFGVSCVHSEYGMAELSSQAYSHGTGIFTTPSWMKVCIRDLNDPFCMLPNNTSGGINIIDLANIHSCAFIQTQDVGLCYPDGSFSITGRADLSETRGCNLMVQ